MKFAEVRFRDCGNCGVQNVAMDVQWSKAAISGANGGMTSWAALSCPRCAMLTTVQLHLPNKSGIVAIADGADVDVVRVFPEDGDNAYKVNHLPEDVASYLETSIRVLQAGVPDAAAVQLRRTLEAAAAAKGVSEPKKPLVHSIQKLIDQGHVTVDFGQALGHVRKVGNLGAHHTDDKLSEEDVRRALLFTVQFLRNLFEVPGELQALATEETKPAPQQDAN